MLLSKTQTHYKLDTNIAQEITDNFAAFSIDKTRSCLNLIEEKLFCRNLYDDDDVPDDVVWILCKQINSAMFITSRGNVSHFDKLFNFSVKEIYLILVKTKFCKIVLINFIRMSLTDDSILYIDNRKLDVVQNDDLK